MKAKTNRSDESEFLEFEEALLRSVEQAQRGEGRVTTPEQIKSRRGRPVGSVKAVKKVATTIRFDADVLQALRASGRGWQSRVNDAIREWLDAQ